MKIEEMAEKPREKALLKGFNTLSDTELLALIIESGIKNNSAFELAMKILSICGSIQQLPHISFSELTSLSGIKTAKALKILACIELSKRMQSTNNKTAYISNSKDVYHYLESKLIYEKQENFIALYLDVKHHIIREKVLFLGSLDASLVHPREVFKEALHISASCMIVAHNHPSGNTEPSQDDFNITLRLKECGEILGITLLDHIIIGDGYYSFKEDNIC